MRVKAHVDEYIGCQIVHKGDQLVLHQHRMIDELLMKLEGKLDTMQNYDTPMASGIHVNRPDKDVNVVNHDQITGYQSIVGTLLYLTKFS